MLKQKELPLLIISILFCLGAGFLGSLVTAPAIPVWYASLAKPDFTPPSWVFAPVWTTLYILMGVALFLVWRKGEDKKAVRVAVSLFYIHLILNVFWSVFFFGMHALTLAFVAIVVLWFFILVLMGIFWTLNRLAGVLLVPYFLWVTFAMILNQFIVRMN